jgi:hypothetical protein
VESSSSVEKSGYQGDNNIMFGGCMGIILLWWGKIKLEL